MNFITPEVSKRIARIGKIAAEHLTGTEWIEFGYECGLPAIVKGHPRLLRSQSWGDSDYSQCCMDVLGSMYESNSSILDEFEIYMQAKLPNHFVSTIAVDSGVAMSSKDALLCKPDAFKINDIKEDDRLISVMMPFAAQFDGVYGAIKSACGSHFSAKRADDIWNSSVLMQDVFDLIRSSKIVICDFTNKNPNVFYEAGIAHTLGKIVIPISQSDSDIPSDLMGHRYLKYLNNQQGLDDLSEKLKHKLNSYISF